ncbi:Hypothetical_protein [Hexamita inflata]|uniref:Hypothetical_protein n=1 Tax=Hexamita inflata TaxID=28002 RepID=A0AA86U4U9_9EUKA|nr:Hypothetical protein HINF_LOCUS25607 [Hexamita inflata]
MFYNKPRFDVFPKCLPTYMRQMIIWFTTFYQEGYCGFQYQIECILEFIWSEINLQVYITIYYGNFHRTVYFNSVSCSNYRQQKMTILGQTAQNQKKSGAQKFMENYLLTLYSFDKSVQFSNEELVRT